MSGMQQTQHEGNSLFVYAKAKARGRAVSDHPPAADTVKRVKRATPPDEGLSDSGGVERESEAVGTRPVSMLIEAEPCAPAASFAAPVYLTAARKRYRCLLGCSPPATRGMTTSRASLFPAGTTAAEPRSMRPDSSLHTTE